MVSHQFSIYGGGFVDNRIWTEAVLHHIWTCEGLQDHSWPCGRQQRVWRLLH